MKSSSAAFTRVELAAVLAALALVSAFALPLFAGTRAESGRVGCFNNLRRLGGAISMWSNNHDDVLPWLTPASQGGTRPDSGSKAASAWTEFIVLTNELSTPYLLACPSDAATKVASHWGNTANGLANSGFRGNAVSYFLSFHGQTELGRSVITGDRDFRPSSPPPLGCSRGVINTASISTFGGQLVEWTNEVHVASGHLLFVDGSVDYVNNSRLRNILIGPEVQNDSASIHFISAR
jgi:hypothetical protein